MNSLAANYRALVCPMSVSRLLKLVKAVIILFFV
jgi:hypothetical protein